MTNSRSSTEGTFALESRHAQRLRQAIPDLKDWTRSWHVEPANILVGQQIVQLLTPFPLHLLEQSLSKATFRRHRDNLWMLGGELIRCRYDDDELVKKPVKRALRQLIEGDGGPLMCPRITEAQQDSLDATCRRLNRYMRESVAGDPSD